MFSKLFLADSQQIICVYNKELDFKKKKSVKLLWRTVSAIRSWYKIMFLQNIEKKINCLSGTFLIFGCNRTYKPLDYL